MVEPSFDLLYRYCKYVVITSKMEKEIPMIALIYIERLLARTGVLMNSLNWRRIALIAMILASKLWDDDSLENEHFPKVMKDVTIKEINTFERVFLDLIGYDLSVSGTEYARYYFIIQTLAEYNEVKIPYDAIPVDKILELQRQSPKNLEDLRQFYQKVTDLEHSV